MLNKNHKRRSRSFQVSCRTDRHILSYRLKLSIYCLVHKKLEFLKREKKRRIPEQAEYHDWNDLGIITPFLLS